MHSIRKVFADNVNRVVDEWLQPEIEQQRAELLEQGIERTVVDEVLQEVKAEYQAILIPKAKQWLKEELKKSVELSKQEKNTNPPRIRR
jgi:Spy/CpxP family protein refolding chaperone